MTRPLDAALDPAPSGHCASADLLNLLALTAVQPGPEHPGMFAALGIDAPADLDVLRAAHTEAFVVQCVPHASIYLGRDGAIGGEAADRVGDFRQLLGPLNEPGRCDLPDALCDLLADYAALACMAETPQTQHAARAFFWEHLACWLMAFCDALGRSAPAPYDAWGTLLADIIGAQAAAFGLPVRLPLHLREAPVWDIEETSASAGDICRALLIPSATGLVLTRADLARAGNTLGIALVPGSRMAMLEMLFVQDTTGALEWLSGEAARQADAHSTRLETLGGVARFWTERSQASDDALANMAHMADASQCPVAARRV